MHQPTRPPKPTTFDRDPPVKTIRCGERGYIIPDWCAQDKGNVWSNIQFNHEIAAKWERAVLASAIVCAGKRKARK